MNVCFEPVDAGAVLTALEIVVHSDLFPHAVIELRRKGTAQRIGGEVTEAAVGPVHILQDAFAVGRNLNAEILPVQIIPGFLQLFKRNTSAEESLFELVADQDVDRIGELIGSGADETAL